MPRLLVGLLLLATAAATPGVAGAGDTPPNIVLVLTDDLASADLSYLPSLRALTSERGRTFRMIVPSPRCAPSRASILTGQYAHNHGVLGNAPRTGGWDHLKRLEPELVPCWLSASGYTTHYSGKYINGYGRVPRHVPPCWNDWQALTKPHGDQRLAFSINANGTVESHTGRYQTDVLAEKTAAFVAHAPEPFFAVFAPFAPHSPWRASDAYAGTMSGLELRRPPSFNEADASDKWQPLDPLDADEIAALDARTRVRLEMMRSVEDGIAQILAALDGRGIADTTYVFFTSDNGFMSGEHRIALGKGVPYRESTEVPLIVSGPGIVAGSVSQHLVANHDLAPTFAALAGARVPKSVDGRSIAELLTDDGTSGRRRVLLEHWSRSKGPVWKGLRTARGVQIQWVGGPWESYDHTVDPYELSAGGDGDADLLRQLASCAGRTCRRLERGRGITSRATCRAQTEVPLLGGQVGRACSAPQAMLP